MAKDLSLKELAALMGRNVAGLRRLAQAGKLPGVYKLGGRWAITQEASDALRKVPSRGGGVDGP